MALDQDDITEQRKNSCIRSLFYVCAQRAHPVNRRVGRWALFQMTEIEQRK